MGNILGEALLPQKSSGVAPNSLPLELAEEASTTSFQRSAIAMPEPGAVSTGSIDRSESVRSSHHRYYPSSIQRHYDINNFMLLHDLYENSPVRAIPFKRPKLADVTGWSSLPCSSTTPSVSLPVCPGSLRIGSRLDKDLVEVGTLQEVSSIVDINSDAETLCEEVAAITGRESETDKAYQTLHKSASVEFDDNASCTPSKSRKGLKRKFSNFLKMHSLHEEMDAEGGSREPKRPVSFSPGIITSAVISKGLKAKLMRSWSNWVLSPREKEKVSLDVWKVPREIRRWSSLKSSSSNTSKVPKFRNLQFPWLRRQTKSPSFPSRMSSEISADRASTSSLNSLPDGRTPWPVPWLDALFLPDFPNKSAISENDFYILGTIAQGAFGHVQRVQLKKTPDAIVYAMKVQKKSDVINQEAVEQVKQEVSIHYALCNSPFVTQLHFAWQSRANLYMLLNYVDGSTGDLHQLWTNEGPFEEVIVKQFAAELAMALDYIHSCNVIYRDLKLENVLLDDNGHIKLVDFGLAKWLAPNEHTHTICGTLQYMAPEILYSQSYGHESDWWSLGVLLHTLLIGQYPFDSGEDHTSMVIPVYNSPSALSKDAQQLLSRLLRREPLLRLCHLEGFKMEPFLTSVPFHALLQKQVHPFDLLPRMKRCNTCNSDIDIESFINGSTDPFAESYDLFENFELLDESQESQSKNI